MNATSLKNLTLISEPEEVVKLLLNEKMGFLQEVDTDHRPSLKEPRKMSFIFAIFKTVYSIIYESHEQEIVLLKAIFKSERFREEVAKYLHYLREYKRNLSACHLGGLQGLYYYLQNLDKVLSYDNSEVRFFLSSAFPDLNKTIGHLKDKDYTFDIKEPTPRECQKPISSGLVTESEDDSGQFSSNSNDDLNEPFLLTNYREMSIVPTYEDIHRTAPPFLRKNLVEYSYKNIDHYLDTQFRLLREDLVRPLHESVKKLIAQQQEEIPEPLEQDMIRTDADLLVYHDVEFVCTRMINLGLLFVVKFDVQRLGRIDWMETSRLLPGSLLCLSADNFKTLFFAKVAERELSDVKMGLIGVMIESNSFDFFTLLSSDTFVAVESIAYFEAYRHSLKVLQDFNHAYSFPLKQYVVDVAMDVRPPPYLEGKDVRYNFSDLAYPLDKRKATDEDGLGHRLMRSQRLESVDLLNIHGFPSDLMDLDQSQFEAFYAALTKQFAVIQGPPGTGKSYLGLRIVQALLMNRTYWCQTGDSETCPILVLSYKNHALDQFLEGVLVFCRKIIRVGGRSESPRLKRLMLGELRKNYQRPEFEEKRRKHCMWSLYHTMEKLDKVGTQIKAVKSGVKILGKELAPYFSETFHCKQLCSLVDSEADPDKLEEAVKKWLEFDKFLEEGDDLSLFMAKLTMDGKSKGSTDDTLLEGGRDRMPLADGDQQINEEEDEEGEEEEMERMANEQAVGKALPKAKIVMSKRLVDPEDYQVADGFDNKKFGVNMFSSVPNDPLSLISKTSTKAEKVKLRLIAFLKKLLRSDEIMTPEEAKKVNNILEMKKKDKYLLYHFWVEKYLQDLKLEVDKFSKTIAALHVELELFAAKRDHMICKDCWVIGMTTTGAAKYRKLVELLAPKIVIIEEAAEILEPYLIASLTHKTEHVILIGDHQQLRPIAGVHELSVKYNLEISLFERMVKNGMACYQLLNQHRMRPSISKLLMGHIYKKLFNHPSVDNYLSIRLMRGHNVHFFDHEHPENHYLGHSYCNPFEAEFVVELVRYLRLVGHSAERISVLTTYNGQLALIKKKMKDTPEYRHFFLKPRRYPPPGQDKNKVMPEEYWSRVETVDSFQGEENDIIIVSFVRSSRDKDIGFLKIPNRVCVALSRARKGFYCIGNFGLYARKSELWDGIVGSLKESNEIGPGITVGCTCSPVTISTESINLRQQNNHLSTYPCQCNRY